MSRDRFEALVSIKIEMAVDMKTFGDVENEILISSQDISAAMENAIREVFYTKSLKVNTSITPVGERSV